MQEERTRRAKRMLPVFQNGLYLLLPSFINQLLALLVIRYSGAGSWGEVVALQLYYYVASHAIAWGNKDALLVKYAADPARAAASWSTSFSTRGLLLLVPALLLTFILYPFPQALHLAAWLALRFFTQSFESLVIYSKAYGAALLSEVAALVPLLLLPVYGKSLQTSEVLIILTLAHLIRALVLLLAGRWPAALLSFSTDIRLLKGSFPFLLLTFSALLMSKADLYCLNVLISVEQVGSYQVLNGFLSMVSVLPSFLLAPYLVSIYKMPGRTLRQVQRQLVFYGLLLSGVFSAGLYLLVPFLYELSFGKGTYVLVFIQAFLPFLYQLNIRVMYRHGRQSLVLALTFSGIVLSVACCFMLVPFMGMNGALAANCVAQAFWLISYKAVNKERAAVAGNPSV